MSSLSFCCFPCSGASLYNLYDEDDEESTIAVPQETVQENNVTMNKMKLLKSKMQSLHTSKKASYSEEFLGNYLISCVCKNKCTL